MLHQKRSELLRLSIIIALMAVSVGIILVQSAKVDTSSQQSSPIFAKISTNSSVNFTIAVSAGSNTVRYVGVNKPASYADINCANLLPIDSAGNAWTCTEVTSSLVKYTSNDGLTAGNSIQVKINATSGAASGNVSFTINTFEDASGTVAQNNTIVNVTNDGQAPIITALSLASGTKVVTNLTNNTWVAKNALVVSLSAISNLAVVGTDKVAVYYNVTNASSASSHIHPTIAISYKAAVQLSNTTIVDESTGTFTGSIPVADIGNGSLVTFVIVANDTVGNQNVTNTTFDGVFNSLAGFNVTVDDAAPVAKAPAVAGVKIIDDSFDAAADNITTSSQLHNFSVNVIDHGGSGIYSVWINVSGALTLMTARGADNLYNATGSIQSLGGSAGDQNLTIYFVTNDSVGNINLQAYSFNLLVDDNDFAFTVYSNATNNFTTSNASIINITATVNANINSTASSNVTIHGPNDINYNMTLRTATTRWSGVGVGGQLVYQSIWFSSVHPTDMANMSGGLPNNVSGTTWSNLSDFGCELQAGSGSYDGDACTLQITWNDIFGRQNSSNITITVDSVAPIVVNITVSNVTDASTGATTNHFVTRASSILNFSVNAYNNVQNVTIFNSTNAAQATNATVLSSGGETNYSIRLSTDDLCGSAVEGACTVNFSVTDQALNTNTSQLSIIKLTIDESAPLVGSFAVNGTVSSGYSYVPGALVMVVRSDTQLNINVTLSDQQSSIRQANLGNATLRNLTLTNQDANFSNTSTLAGYGCPAGVEVNCTLSVQAFDNVSLSNNSVSLTFSVDDLAPRVDSFTTDLSLKHRVGGINNRINFSVNVTDANLGAFNVTIGNTSTVVLNSTSGSSRSNSTFIMYSVSTTLADLGCSENANCSVTVFANDSAGNVNDSVSISVLSDNAVLAINNRTWAAAFKDVVFTTPNPTLTVNMSSAAQCRYDAGSLTNYSDMSSQFNVEGTRHTSFTLSNLLDADYEYPVSCVDLDGDNVASSTVKFRVDTTSLWNITIGATGALSAKADYFWNANRWYSTAMLANTNILTTTSHNNAADTYNVTNVLASLVSANPSGATNNLSVMFAHNTVANTWTSYIPGDQAGNDFLNFTSDVTTYYFNLSQGNERLEIG